MKCINLQEDYIIYKLTYFVVADYNISSELHRFATWSVDVKIIKVLKTLYIILHICKVRTEFVHRIVIKHMTLILWR